MKENKIKLVMSAPNGYGRFPLGLECWIQDNTYEERVEVDTTYLIRVLRRLTQLKNIRPDQIAEDDIPDTIAHILSVVPKEVQEYYEKHPFGIFGE